MGRLIMRYPGGKAKAFTMSYDDGVIQDIRLIKIMDKYGLKGTFNLNSGMFLSEEEKLTTTDPYRRLTEKEAVDLYGNSGHEVAVHALTHPYLEQMPCERVMYEILEDKRRLENLFGYSVRGAAYPYGTTGDLVIDILKNAGIVYARTTQITHEFKIPENWLKLSATTRNTNSQLMQTAEKFIAPSDEFCRPMLFYMWGHSWEFERDNSWDKMEKFCEMMGNNKDIWYATNIGIFDYITAWRSLRFNVDMNFVENPTATDVYFCWNEKMYCVKSGERLSLTEQNC